MYEVTVAIRNALLANSNLTAFVGDRIYPSHILTVSEPVYPAISMGRQGGGMDDRLIATDMILQIDVWAKLDESIGLMPYDLLWAIYNEVHGTINLKPLPGVVAPLVKEIYVNDDLYESDNQTWHLASKYKIIAL